MVRGTLVCREGGGNEGKKAASTWAPKNDNEEVLHMKNESCRLSEGAAGLGSERNRQAKKFSYKRKTPEDDNGEIMTFRR